MEVFPPVVRAVIRALVVFVLYMILETLYKAYLNYGNARIPVMPKTRSSYKVFPQDPNNSANINLPFSENQLTGIEFSYSTFIYISDDSYDSNSADPEGWRSIFYKGYESSPFPLLGPGVFVNTAGPSPILRVIMNTYDTWYNPIDVKQIPFNKWIHLTLVLRKNTLEIYVNGNLANKKTFHGTLPYQNYQPLILFPTATTSRVDFVNPSDQTTKKRGIPPGDNFFVKGKFSGYISNMYYFSYALTYSEIQSMMEIGPSKEFDNDNMDIPPYLIDSWWTQRKG